MYLLEVPPPEALLYEKIKKRMDHFYICATGVGLKLLKANFHGRGRPTSIIFRDMVEAARLPIERPETGETVFDSEAGLKVHPGG